MKKLDLSLKSLLIGAAVIGISTSTAAAAPESQLCNRGGYIKRVTQGWPHNNNIVGITIRDQNGVETNFATAGSGNVHSDPWARALHAMALTAYVNQSYVYPTAASGHCSKYYRAADGKDWVARWEGLVIASAPGVY